MATAQVAGGGGRVPFCLSRPTKKTRKKNPTKKRWWAHRAISGGPRRLLSRILRAISNARKKRKWPNCNSPEEAARRWKRSRPYPIRKPAATILALAAAARNTRNAAEPDSRRSVYCVGKRRHLAGALGEIRTQIRQTSSQPGVRFTRCIRQGGGGRSQLDRKRTRL